MASDEEDNLSSGEIAADIERFIYDNIDSVEQLEVLLLLAGEPQKEWSAVEVSQKLCRQKDSIAGRLENLRDRGILSVRQEAQLLDRYSPDAQQHALVQGLNTAYQVRKHTVISLIFTKPPDTLRVFSDAFRIRRDD